MMFEKIKRNLFKFFNSSWNREKKSEIELEVISQKDKVGIKEVKRVDPRDRERKKFQMIAKRTKSWRIREKNIKRLVEYYDWFRYESNRESS